MKIAVIGAGAIGGYVGVKLALAGEDVTFIVRGANLAAIRQSGMKLVMADGTEHVARNVQATDDYAEAGPQDVVVLAMKAHQVGAVANDVPKLFGPQTAVVTGWYLGRAVNSRFSRTDGCEIARWRASDLGWRRVA